MIGRSNMTSHPHGHTVDLDPLSDVLGRLECRLLERLELPAPWGIEVPEGVVAFYAVAAGRGRLTIDRTRTEIALAPGDLVVLPQSLGHRLQDAADSPAVPIGELLGSDRPAGVRQPDNAPPATRLLACHLVSPRHCSHLLRTALPPVIRVPSTESGPAPWLHDTLRLMTLESGCHAAGSRAIVDRLAQVVVIQAIRAFVCEFSGNGSQWPSALLDPSIAKALGLIHRFPERPWTVAALAFEVAMSRSAFAGRFAELVGASPIQYLTERRMQTACQMLRDPDIGLAQIASRVGYRSPAAFSHAFRRSFGVAPGKYRRAASTSKA